MENNAPVPLTALASVNQSARWNSRIIAKGLFGLDGVMTDSVPHFLRCALGGWTARWLATFPLGIDCYDGRAV
jgi:hypothetical protein